MDMKDIKGYQELVFKHWFVLSGTEMLEEFIQGAEDYIINEWR
jgi:hypothetical protein